LFFSFPAVPLQVPLPVVLLRVVLLRAELPVSLRLQAVTPVLLRVGLFRVELPALLPVGLLLREHPVRQRQGFRERPVLPCFRLVRYRYRLLRDRVGYRCK